MSELVTDIPHNRATAAIALFAPGLGETVDDPLGSTLARMLPVHGIALARLSLAESFNESRDLAAVPYTEQMERAEAAVQDVQAMWPGLPVHIIGHSDGALAAIAAGLFHAHQPEVPHGTVTLLAPPLLSVDEYLDKMIDHDLTRVPDKLGTRQIMGSVDVRAMNRRVWLPERVWREAQTYYIPSALGQLRRELPTRIVFAGADEVLGDQASRVERLAHVINSPVETIPEATHWFPDHRDQIAQEIIECASRLMINGRVVDTPPYPEP